MPDDEGFVQQGRRRNGRNRNNVFQGSHPARDLEETTYQVLGPKAGFNHINTVAINLSTVRIAAGWPTEKAITDFVLSDQMGVMVEDVDTCSTKKDRGEVWLTLKTDEKCMEVEQRLLKGVKWLVNRAAPDVMVFGQRLDKPTLHVTVVGVAKNVPKVEMERIMGRYGKISSLHRGSHPYLSRGKKEGQEGWVWDGRWNIYIKVPEEGHLPSNIIVADDHWQLYFRGSVQACWKCLSPDHLAWRCQAKPRPKSNVNWVPYCGAHVGVANPITEEEMDEEDFDYNEVASQRSQEEADKRRSETVPSGNKIINWKEKVGQQEKMIQKLTDELSNKLAKQEEVMKKKMEEWAEKEARMESESVRRDKLIQMLSRDLVKAQEESSKRGRGDSVDETSQSKTPKLSENVDGTPGGVPEGGTPVVDTEDGVFNDTNDEGEVDKDALEEGDEEVDQVVKEVMGKVVEDVVASEASDQPLPSDDDLEGNGDLNDTQHVPPIEPSAEVSGGSPGVIIPNPHQPLFSQDSSLQFDAQSLGGLPSQDMFNMTQSTPPLPGVNNHVQPKTQRVAHVSKQ